MATSYSDERDQSVPLTSLLGQARAGQQEAVGQLLEAARDYLRLVAKLSLDSEFRGKLSRSDLVQETLMEAHRDFSGFRGRTSDELMGWLHRMLVNNLLNHYRDLRRHKRDIGREQPLEDDRRNLAEMLSAGGDSPSRIASRREQKALLERVLTRLSSDYQQVITLRHREQLSFPEIGIRMNRSADAVRMLWYRAFDQLSRELNRPLSDGCE